MRWREVDAVVIGGGAAGLAAAAAMGRRGIGVVVVEQEESPGGVLNQCIHDGFGVHYFNEELTGPEYAQRFEEIARGTIGVQLECDTTAIDAKENGDRKVVTTVSRRDGVTMYSCRAIVLAGGCWERSRAIAGIPGTRPAGVLTAGLAQRFVNLVGQTPGTDVVIVGSGDVGLITARRLTWVGARVHAIIERGTRPAGLTRNVAQCVEDLGIPLLLSHAVTEIHGAERVEAVSVTPIVHATLDYTRTFRIPCNTLLISAGLVPNTELAARLAATIDSDTMGPLVDARLMTSQAGVFACGNALFVHDLVDSVTAEASRCGDFLCDYLVDEGGPDVQYPVRWGTGVRFVVPKFYAPDQLNILSVRPAVAREPSEVLLKLDGSQVMKVRIQAARPSEMINIQIGPVHLRDARPHRPNELEIDLL